MASRDELMRLAEVYQRNLPVFCADLLRIKLEAGGLSPFYLNPTQFKLHNMLENQLSKEGKVRAIVLKPRREGMSTYIGARFYHKTIFNAGWQTYILTHQHKATRELFKMVKMFHDNMLPEFKPSTSTDSKTGLDFDKISSGYSLGTAGSKSGGRGELAHTFHGSEVAFWRDAEEVASSAIEIVGDEPNTEIILESTGFPDTYFEDIWNRAVSGEGDFLPLFFAWYESDRNRSDATDLILTPEEKELMKLYPTMDIENIAFRRSKLSLASEAKFRREYPAVPADAFSADGRLSYISPETVTLAASRNNLTKQTAPIVLGCDPSSSGRGDTVGLVVRQDDKVIKIAEFRRETVLERAAVINSFIESNGVDHTFMDAGGSGKEIYEILVSWGLSSKQMTLVYFGESASDKKKYPNKRNEMYDRMRSWLETKGEIPNNQKFRQELSLTKEVVNSMGEYVLESKKNMRKSPNLADGLALTFAHPIRQNRYIGVTSYED